MLYHQDNLNTLDINNLQTANISKGHTLETDAAYDSQCSLLPLHLKIGSSQPQPESQ